MTRGDAVPADIDDRRCATVRRAVASDVMNERIRRYLEGLTEPRTSHFVAGAVSRGCGALDAGHVGGAKAPPAVETAVTAAWLGRFPARAVPGAGGSRGVRRGLHVSGRPGAHELSVGRIVGGSTVGLCGRARGQPRGAAAMQQRGATARAAGRAGRYSGGHEGSAGAAGPATGGGGDDPA